MSQTPKLGEGVSKALGAILIFMLFFVIHYWYIIVPIVVIIVGLILYSKFSHHELQKKSLEVDIRHKENQIEMSQKEMELRQLELKAQLMDLQSKMEKRGAKADQINLTNQAMRQKLGKSNYTDYTDQINDLQ